MKSNKTFNTLFIGAGICIIWLISGHFIYKNYHENIKSKKKMYCYQQYWKVVNPVLFVKDEKYIDSLIAYYRKIENGDTNPFFNFPPLSLPYDTCVYLLGYERDSLVAKVVCYYNWGKQGSFVKGYVYKNTLHSNPPPVNIIKKYLEKSIDVYKIDSAFYPFLDSIIKQGKKCSYYDRFKTVFIYEKPIFQEVNCTKCPNIAIFSENASTYNYSNCIGVFEFKRHLFFCDSLCNKELLQKTASKFHVRYLISKMKDAVDGNSSA